VWSNFLQVYNKWILFGFGKFISSRLPKSGKGLSFFPKLFPRGFGNLKYQPGTKVIVMKPGQTSE
jgi:hypothetical protein